MVAPKSTLSKIASKRNFHSGDKGMPRLTTKAKETAIRSSKDVDNSESEKWHDASRWSVGSTALGRGLQMTRGRPDTKFSFHDLEHRRVSLSNSFKIKTIAALYQLGWRP